MDAPITVPWLIVLLALGVAAILVIALVVFGVVLMLQLRKRKSDGPNK